jgi:glyoxylase-like metal-dependent hydrolase (beta-lactamase superfamily II)
MRAFEYGGVRFTHWAENRFRLDGGAMFGVVPRVLWERVYPPDHKNRITLSTNLLIAQAPGFTALVDTGVGNKISEKNRGVYAVEAPGMPAGFPLPVDDVEIVVLTHLHFDHCGGSTVETAAGSGDYAPTFPRARYFVQRAEYQDATDPSERSRASYWEENFVPLFKQNRLTLLDGDGAVNPGIRVLVTGGHTRGHQIVAFETSEGVVAFMADFIPTTRHIPIPYIMAYDLYPVDSLKARKRLYPMMADERWLLVFEHDDEAKQGFLERESEDRYRFVAF